MADINLSNVANLLYELRGPLQYNFRKKYPLSAELQRKMAREQFSGSGIRIPVVLNSLQGGGNPGESGGACVPGAPSTGTYWSAYALMLVRNADFRVR